MKISVLRSMLATATVLACWSTASTLVRAEDTPGTVMPAGVAPADESNNLVRIELDKFEDGSITTARLKVTDKYFGKNPPFKVKFSIPGVHCQQDTLEVKRNCKKTGDQEIKCKPVGCPEKAKNGDVIDVKVQFDYTFPNPAPKPQEGEYGATDQVESKTSESQMVKRKVKNCGSCSGQGDPHIKTLDNATFDFHEPGVFTFFDSGPFKVYAFQDNCQNVLDWENIPSCFQGAAIAYGDSIVRFYLNANGAIDVAKGSQELQWLQVKKLEGQTDGYRVFMAADGQSYVDVAVGEWDLKHYKYLNVAVQAGPYYHNDQVKGLMGNWNGNADDDVKDKNQLVELYKAKNLDDTIFTCTDCAKFTSPVLPTDEDSVKLTKDLPMLQGGYTPITITDLKPFQPVITVAAPKALRRRNRRSLEENKALQGKAEDLCNKVIHGIPHCGKLVENVPFWVDGCVKDVVLTGQVEAVDASKVAFLRECRRGLDSLLESKSCKSKKTNALKQYREELTFGDVTQCKDNCGGKGKCLSAGCGCDKGFTGLVCEMATA